MHSKLLTQQPINLAEFDSKYCTITGTPELSKEFGLWLEGVFNTYADKAKDSIIYEQVVHDLNNKIMNKINKVTALIMLVSAVVVN